MSVIEDKMGTQETQDQGKCEHPLVSVPLILFPLPSAKGVTLDMYINMDRALFLCVFPSLCEPLDVTPLPGNSSLR